MAVTRQQQAASASFSWLHPPSIDLYKGVRDSIARTLLATAGTSLKVALEYEIAGFPNKEPVAVNHSSNVFGQAYHHIYDNVAGSEQPAL